MNIKLLSDKAKIPTRGSVNAAGYDLYTTETYELKVGERKAFKTDICLSIVHDFFGRISPRSGLSVKKGIDVMAGVIDEDYRGEILVVLINLGQENVIINEGDKIAQIIFQQYGTTIFNQVDDLDTTVRNDGRFGSSDIVIPYNPSGFGSTDAIPYKTQSMAERETKKIKMPDAVHSALTEKYKEHPIEVNNKAKYSELIKERENKL
jgi:dUTP pyrophosphatase